MSSFIKQNRLLSIIAILFVLGVVYYAFFWSKNSDSPDLLSSDVQAPSPQSQQLLVILANLKTIQLNGAVFSDPVFLSLSDFGTVITPEAVGRRNPFAPFIPVSGSTNLPIPGR